MIENEMTVSVPLEVVKASEIEPKEVKWLWYPYIPFSKVTLLQGDPGDGKSKLMLKSNFLSEKYGLEDKVIKFYPQQICNSFADFSGKPSSDNDIQLMIYSIRE